MQVLMLSPEPPYPLHGGGAFRTASLLHYFARFAQVDLILISDSGHPAPLPARTRAFATSHPRFRATIADWPLAMREMPAARSRGIPPLIDRLAGLSASIERALAGRHYDFGIIEHFWCAPYVDLLAGCCDRNGPRPCTTSNPCCTNVAPISVTASSGQGIAASLPLRENWKRLCCRAFRTFLSPRSRCKRCPRHRPGRACLGVSELAPLGRCASVDRISSAGFFGQFRIPPQHRCRPLSARRDLARSSSRRHPELRLRLVGRGDTFIRHLLPPGSPDTTGIEVTGPVERRPCRDRPGSDRRGAAARWQRNPHQDPRSMGGGALCCRDPSGRRRIWLRRTESISPSNPIRPGLPLGSAPLVDDPESRQRIGSAGPSYF